MMFSYIFNKKDVEKPYLFYEDKLKRSSSNNNYCISIVYVNYFYPYNVLGVI